MRLATLKQIVLLEKMSYEDASDIFLKHTGKNPRLLSGEELKKAWRVTAAKIHPDRGGKLSDMQDLNAAYDVLSGFGAGPSRPSSGSGFGGSGGYNYSGSGRESDFGRGRSNKRDTNKSKREANSDVPEWAWAGYSGGLPPLGNIYRHDYRDVNYIKKRMWELSGKSKQEWTIWAFDGTFFRGVTTVFGNEKIFKDMAEAMYTWNSEGANSYETRAIIAVKGKTKKGFIIYADGKYLSKNPPEVEVQGNPGNSRSFVQEFIAKLDEMQSQK